MKEQRMKILRKGLILIVLAVVGLVEYVQLVLGGKIGHYLSLDCDHGRLEDQ